MENETKGPGMLYRSNTNRVVFGVCGGLGEYFNLDPVIFRIIFILLTFSAGSGILVYLVLAFLIPNNPSPTPAPKHSEPIDIKARVHELAEELRELRKSSSGHRHGRGVFRLFLGLLLLIIGFGLLAQNLNLLPGLNLNFYVFTSLWPILLILIGLSIISKRAH